MHLVKHLRPPGSGSTEEVLKGLFQTKAMCQKRHMSNKAMSPNQESKVVGDSNMPQRH